MIQLVGGSAANNGILYALNRATGIYGPVCDDLFTIIDVNIFSNTCTNILLC